MYKDVRVLVVDDNEDDAFFLKRGFLRAGVTVPLQFVQSGEEAMSYLEGREKFADRTKYPAPKLMLLDIKMPGTDGFDVLEWVREQPRLGLLPVIMLSSSDRQEDVNRAYELGANSYMMKPGTSEGYEYVAKGFASYWLKHNVLPQL
jgi:CheY-like chemotaxis protein